MNNELNNKIFNLVPLVTKKLEPKKLKEDPNVDLVGIPFLFNLGKVENIKRSRSDGYGNIIEAYKNGLGLDIQNYRKLSDIANQIIEFEPYASFATVNFIEEHLFEWIIETYKNNKAKNEPLNYLQDTFENDLKEYHFYFRVHALGINSKFKIGKVDFTFFSDDLLLDYSKKFKEQFPEKPEKEFELIFKDYISKPIAKVSSKGIQDKAKRNAQRQVNVAIDSLKCFLIKESINSSSKIMDAEYRFTDKFPNSFIYDTSSEKFDFNLQFERTDGIKPISLNKEKIEELFKSGLGEVSDFISNSPTNELSRLILNTISSIGTYSSTRNLHERVVKIISAYEILFIPLKKGKGRGLTIIKLNVLPKIIEVNELQMAIKLFVEFYDIRDKYLHNGLEKHIDIDDLFKVQKITIFLLQRLIRLNKELTNSLDLLKYFEIK
ncbi:hypothetical protein A7A78_12240 [Aequorivita soesokkakensis]|uniref:Apea-like HEPN domain-containing protein n=1 Tax=Aequorivita soesokkakensis TaxID=1385699 RepID=A0A1A9LDP3_9FLAO|nr:hypothetical protein [Aequorivita soesokkakensis]OAD91323.1 hypothetical protein A7A78_12240 [Aequorivita soesokkakensis]